MTAPSGAQHVVVTGSADNLVCCYNWAQDEIVMQGSKAHKHDNDVFRMSYHKDASILFTASRDKKLRSFRLKSDDLTNMESLQTFEGHQKAVFCLDVHPSGEKLASGSRDLTCRIWDVETGKLLAKNETPRNIIHNIKWFDNASKVITGGEDLKIRFFDASSNNMKLVHTISGFAYQPICSDVSDDGNYLIVGHNGFEQGCMLKVYDLRTYKEVANMEGHDKTIRNVHIVRRADLAEGKDLVMSCADDSTVKVWDYKL
eukprot:gene19762-1000_t